MQLSDFEENLLQTLTSGQGRPGIDYDYMMAVCDNKIRIEDYRKEIIFIFYRTGLVGLKVDATSPFSWSHIHGISVSSSEITDGTKVNVHKTFWRVLGITDIGRPSDQSIS
jgi:hypothetical protein